MYNITRSYQNHILKCVAQNDIGISSDSETFDIICKFIFNDSYKPIVNLIVNVFLFVWSDQPSFSKRPENVEADSQEQVTLDCEVDANPVPEIVWVFDPSDRVSLHNDKSETEICMGLRFFLYDYVVFLRKKAKLKYLILISLVCSFLIL